MTSVMFTKTHEWIRMEEDIATLGITEHAQDELGDIVFVELPQVGDTLTQEARCGTIESTKTASEIFAPLEGEVVEVNTALTDNPQWINEEPMEKGWIVKIKVKDKSKAQNLMDEASYKTFVEEES